ncbi:uncharacterized protein LOC144637412 [Oculina patagonica]
MMKIVFAVFVGWAMLLMVLRFGRASSILYDQLNGTSLIEEDKRQRCFFPKKPKTIQVRDIMVDVLKKTQQEVECLYNYGCWCGLRGEGSDKYVDNFDFCCKAHDFCESGYYRHECKVPGGDAFSYKEFSVYNNYTCAPLSAYTDTSNEDEKKCRHAVCLCDMEMVRCMKHYKNVINTDNILSQQCTIKGGTFCKKKADVIVLIQDSQGISVETVQSIKTVVRRLLTLLGSETQDYNFALATFGTSRQMSCFGDAADTIRYMEREYRHGESGTKNLLKRALEKMVLKQFEKRRDDRKGDATAKILVVFSDGNSEHENGNDMDTFWLEKTAKQLRVDNNIKMVGALIPNTQNTQRLQELKSIVSDPQDAIDLEVSAADLNDIADRLVARVRRLVCPNARYTVEFYTPDTYVNSKYRMTVRIEGEGGKKTADHVLYKTTPGKQGDLQVIKAEFFDRDVGNMKRIEILPKRIKGGIIDGWFLEEVKIKKGQETVTAVFKKEIPEWPRDNEWFSAKVFRRPYVRYFVEVYTPDKSAEILNGLAVKIKGEEHQTQVHGILNKMPTETQGDLLVIKARFKDINVGKIKRISIRPYPRRKWTLNKVKVKKGRQTVIVEFNKEIEAISFDWFYVDV